MKVRFRNLTFILNFFFCLFFLFSSSRSEMCIRDRYLFMGFGVILDFFTKFIQKFYIRVWLSKNLLILFLAECGVMVGQGT